MISRNRFMVTLAALAALFFFSIGALPAEARPRRKQRPTHMVCPLPEDVWGISLDEDGNVAGLAYDQQGASLAVTLLLRADGTFTRAQRLIPGTHGEVLGFTADSGGIKQVALTYLDADNSPRLARWDGNPDHEPETAPGFGYGTGASGGPLIAGLAWLFEPRAWQGAFLNPVTGDAVPVQSGSKPAWLWSVSPNGKFGAGYVGNAETEATMPGLWNERGEGIALGGRPFYGSAFAVNDSGVTVGQAVLSDSRGPYVVPFYRLASGKVSRPFQYGWLSAVNQDGVAVGSSGECGYLVHPRDGRKDINLLVARDERGISHAYAVNRRLHILAIRETGFGQECVLLKPL